MCSLKSRPAGGARSAVGCMRWLGRLMFYGKALSNTLSPKQLIAAVWPTGKPKEVTNSRKALAKALVNCRYFCPSISVNHGPPIYKKLELVVKLSVVLSAKVIFTAHSG